MIDFILSNFLRGLAQKYYSYWESGKDYIIGDIILSDNKKYIATSNGKSGLIDPTHTGGTFTDGGVSWLYVETLGSLDRVTETAYVSLSEQLFKKLSPYDFSLGVKYKKWKNGDEYNSTDLVLVSNDLFVVITGGVSTIQPTDTGSFNFETADGIIWRYCGRIPKQEQRFITDTFIPIHKTEYDGKEYQWTANIVSQSGVIEETDIPQGINATINPDGTVQKLWIAYETDEDFFVIDKAPGRGLEYTVNIEDGIQSVTVSKGGQGYSQNSKIVVIDETGTGAELKPIIDVNGSITSIEILNNGINYKQPEIYVVSENHLIITVERKKALWNVLKNGNADALLMNTTVKSDLEIQYNEILLVSTQYGSPIITENLENYNVVYRKSIDTTQRVSSQEEEITLEFILKE